MQRRRANTERRAADPLEPPAHLAEPTREWWASIAPGLEDHQLRTLTIAAEAFDRKEEARCALQKQGLSYQDERGQWRARPEIGFEKNACATYLRALAQLKLDVPPPKPDRNGYGLGISYRNLPGQTHD